MTRDEFETKFVPKFLEELKLKITSKGKQYGPTNFDSTIMPIALFEGRAPQQVCITLMLKHLKAVQLDPLTQHKDRLEDLIIYSLLIAAFNPEQGRGFLAPEDWTRGVDVTKEIRGGAEQALEP